MKHADHIISELKIMHFLKQYSFPGFVKVKSQLQDNENLYIEMEYIKGCTLLSQLRNPVVRRNVEFYTSEVLQCLEFLHGHNIIYRDLKPENIMISMRNYGHIQLVDFGFAKQLGSIHDKTKTKCGTPAYLAPEIMKGEPYDYKTDIWSLGILIYEMLTGKTPFHANSTAQIYKKLSVLNI